jgi:hypothetical protein
MIRQALAALVLLSVPFGPALGSEGKADCMVTVSYGSAGSGIDRALAQKIQHRFRHDPRIVKRERRPKGHEGEFDLCLTIEPATKARTVFRAIRALMPAYSDKAPTTLTLHGGGRYQTKWKGK